ncbi:MAG: sigma-54 dependent transcriptional regulator [Planctomycetota bacterium]|nr:sigma-54 dependent transcriptional regulator [Planctomycetota bacterium]
MGLAGSCEALAGGEITTCVQADALARNTVGSSEPMRQVFAEMQRVAPTDFTVLITGETGAGKEVVARAIHRMSPRASGPFVPVDGGSIPASLVEGELFGHEKGSFTGADRCRPGKFEVASGGTLFLDEISNLPLDVQPKLLRALQDKQIWRIGGVRPLAADIRIIAATNHDLASLVRAGAFRRDLYHRLNEFSIVVPPLRERCGDIVPLATQFRELANRELKKGVLGFSEAALQMLLAYRWPGNVRELRNVVRRAVLLADSRIETLHLVLLDPPPDAGGLGPGELAESFDGSVPFKEMVRRAVIRVERQILIQVLTQTSWNKAEAARLLRIDYKNIHKKVRDYGLGIV